jgi:hypothetical protein
VTIFCRRKKGWIFNAEGYGYNGCYYIICYKKVLVDSSLPLNVKWDNCVVELKEVAVVKSYLFALILGLDWIIKSKTSLVVENDKIVSKSSDA